MNMSADKKVNDGIYGMLPREEMSESVKKFRDHIDMVPGAPLFRREFGFYSMDKWVCEEGLSEHDYFNRGEIFMFDESAVTDISTLGWVVASFFPSFEEKVLEDRGDYELVQDSAGRGVLYFKGRRSGFMPEYEAHPVTDMKSWKENCKWRMDPDTPERREAFSKIIEGVVKEARQGKYITQRIAGGYMYLRSLIGPEGLLYAFYDAPELIHDCMEAWYNLAEAMTAEAQKHVTFDEVFFGEDICYNCGPLISPDMMREFLFPYYTKLLDNIRSRQLDKERKLNIHIDTDGNCLPVIDVYKEIGMNKMSPFEVASGCDVVEIGEKYPDLIMSGGIDKRILAAGKDAIDRELERIIPVMRKRGGYIPTCDHGVPEEVSLENYLHYRKRCVELGG
ncbi:MAG: uroporphyrinogen decarboxylase family protein [Planctomycetota bacterium]